MEKKLEKFWNYRVIQDADKHGHVYFSIRGVFYRDFGKTIEGWDADETRLVFGQGDSISEFLKDVSVAATKPLLVVSGQKLIEDTSGFPAETIIRRREEK